MVIEEFTNGDVVNRPVKAHTVERKVLWTIEGNDPQVQPLAFVLAGYGDAWVANGLAKALVGNTVHCLQPGDCAPATAATELAAAYVEKLRAVQPNGPYCLCGYSAGAAMALEMATQLRTHGEEVGLLAVLDPLFMRYTWFEHLTYCGFQQICGIVSKFLPVRLRVLQILSAMIADRGLDTHLKSLAGHRPKRYSGEIVYFRARWSLGRSPFLVRQWRWFTGAIVKVETVPGDHHTFIRPPHVRQLALRLQTAMRQACVRRVA